MDYILSGNPQDVEKVLRENRIRVARGVIKFTPLAAEREEPDLDSKDAIIADSKDAAVVDDKKPKNAKKKKSE